MKYQTVMLDPTHLLLNLRSPRDYVVRSSVRSSVRPSFVRACDLTRFNKIAIQGTPQMAVDKEAICLSRVYSYYPKCNFPLFYV